MGKVTVHISMSLDEGMKRTGHSRPALLSALRSASSKERHRVRLRIVRIELESSLSFSSRTS
jgi:hypothetical protein